MVSSKIAKKCQKRYFFSQLKAHKLLTENLHFQRDIQFVLLQLSLLLHWAVISPIISTFTGSMVLHLKNMAVRIRTGAFLALLLLCLPPATGQADPPTFQHLSIIDGLSNNTVYSILQDKQGFLWFGTDDGLNCYDGVKVRVYSANPDSDAALADNQVNALCEDSVGNLWLGLWTGGLCRYDRITGRFDSFRHNPSDSSSISSNTIWALACDKDGRIWAGSPDAGLNCYLPSAQSFQKYRHDPAGSKSLSSDQIRSICVDHGGVLWIATDGGGLNLFDSLNGTFTHYRYSEQSADGLCSDHLNILFEDSRGQLWIGSSDRGISILAADRKSFRKLSLPGRNGDGSPTPVRAISEGPDGNIWIGTDGGGLYLYNTAEDRLINLLHDPASAAGLSSNVIFSLYQSRDGSMWLGTFQGGVDVYDPKKYKFTPFKTISEGNDGLSYKSVMSVREDSQGYLWFGTDGGGLDRFDPGSGKFTHFRHSAEQAGSISGDVVKAIYEDSGGSLWFGTHSRGLNRYDRETGVFHNYLNNPDDPWSLSQNDVWDITEDGKGRLWIATLSGGLNCFDPASGRFTRYTSAASADSLCCNNVFCVLYDPLRDGIWAGTKFGLSFLEFSGATFKSFLHDYNDPVGPGNTEVTTLFEAEDGTIWIGTDTRGLLRFDPEQQVVKAYTTDDGLIGNSVAAMVEDREKNLWISTGRGLSRFSPEKATFRNYTVEDGLQSNEFLKGSACITRDGKLVFGGIDGFNLIDPARVRDNDYLPEVVITELFLFNRELQPGDASGVLDSIISLKKQLTLKPGQSFITFEFTALNFTNAEKNKFAYMLSGFDSTWNDIGTRRSVSFSNLAPGNYTFHVKASNNDGLWNESGHSIRIRVLPPFYRTFWFRSLLILAILLLTFLIYARRMKQIKKQQKVLEGLVQQRTDELAREKERVEKQNRELKETHEAIVEQNREIREMSEKVHRSDEEKLRFFTTISHEIRTPLTLILGPLERLLNSQDNPDTRTQLKRVYNNADKLKRLVNQILDFRKMDSGADVLTLERTGLNRLVEDLSSSFIDQAQQQALSFNVVTGEDEIELLIDPEKVEKILINLLSNAFKFTPVKGSITVSTGHVAADAETLPSGLVKSDRDGYAFVRVSDTGYGIPAGQAEKIFERFYQARGSSRQTGEGTGIGLSIALGMAQMHHGTISVESEEGKGSVFTLFLPLGGEYSIHKDNSEENIPAESIYTGMEEARSGKVHPGGQQALILLVEDNADLRSYLREELEQDYRVVEAPNGKSALHLTKRHRPDIIISDIMMPEMDGLEFCRAIKSEIETSHIPVILLTARTGQENKLGGLDSGADDYITKPFDRRELRLKIDNLCRTRRQMQEKFSRELVLQPSEVTVSSTDELFIRKTLEIIEEQLADPGLSAASFLPSLGVSRSVFYLKIKELSGMSANEFIKTMRLKRAASLLSQGRFTVAEVAYQVGFSDPNHFGKCFKKMFGIPAGSYAREKQA